MLEVNKDNLYRIKKTMPTLMRTLNTKKSVKIDVTGFSFVYLVAYN